MFDLISISIEASAAFFVPDAIKSKACTIGTPEDIIVAI